MEIIEENMALIVIAGIAIVSAIYWHSYVKNFFLSIMGATFTTIVIYQIASYIYLGYLDPFYILAIIASMVEGIVISVLTGVILTKTRKNKKTRIAHVQPNK